MKKMIIILLFLFLCLNLGFGESLNEKREYDAETLYIEAQYEWNLENYDLAIQTYNFLIEHYSDTKYFKDKQKLIEDDIEHFKRMKKIEEDGVKFQKKMEKHFKEVKKLTKELAIMEAIEEAKKEQKIVIGMTREQVLESWGKPSDIKRYSYGRGVYEDWIYKYEDNSYDYLKFKDGILESWHVDR